MQKTLQTAPIAGDEFNAPIRGQSQPWMVGFHYPNMNRPIGDSGIGYCPTDPEVIAINRRNEWLSKQTEKTAEKYGGTLDDLYKWASESDKSDAAIRGIV